MSARGCILWMGGGIRQAGGTQSLRSFGPSPYTRPGVDKPPGLSNSSFRQQRAQRA